MPAPSIRIVFLAVTVLLTTSDGPITVSDPFKVRRTFPPASEWTKDFNRLRLDPSLFRPFKKSAQTRLEYAQMCAVEMGPFPEEYDCFIGQEIPIKVNGNVVTTPIPGYACDKPAKLEMGKSNCVPGAHLDDLSPKDRPDVTVIGMCRKYDKPMTADHFADIAIIAHNRKTGTTCYFQSPVASGPPEGFDGHHVPGPTSTSAAADKQWIGPKTGPDGINYTTPGLACTNCHDADPFILTPYVQQVVDEDMLARWNASTGHNVDKFGWFAPLNSRPWVVRAGAEATAKCTQCHRVGGGSLTRIAIGQTYMGQTNLHNFMPPGAVEPATDANRQTWSDTYSETITALEQCLYLAIGQTPKASCNAVLAGRVTK